MKKRTAKTGCLLLLEFVTSERWVYNSRFFPFIKGCADEYGFKTRWVTFGIEYTIEKTSNFDFKQYAELTGIELDFLKEQIREINPTHIIISDAISEEVMACLKAENSNVSILFMTDFPYKKNNLGIHAYIQKLIGTDIIRTDSMHFNMEDRISHTAWLLNWLGLGISAENKKYIVGTFKPSYEIVSGNNLVKEFKPNLLILGGIICDHSAKIKNNKVYQDLDLSNCDYDYGCAYCTHNRKAQSDLGTDPVITAKEQFEGILKTQGENGRSFGNFEICDIRLFGMIDRFFDMILDTGLQPGTFYFEPRADRFLSMSEKLASSLQKIEYSGHIISILRMGAESLVEKENILYNKNISLEQLDRAVLLQQDLKKNYPNSFDYDPTFGFITCSPWTTLEDFKNNIELAIERKFDPKGVWLYTPLLLYHNSPMYLLAESQGDILADSFDDLSFLYEASANRVSTGSFAAWKFKDVRMSIAFSMIVRFCAVALKHKYSDAIFSDDKLYKILLGKQSTDGFFARPDIFARVAVNVINDNCEIDDRLSLLNMAIDNYSDVFSDFIGDIPQGYAYSSDHGQKLYRLRYLFREVKNYYQGYFDNIVLYEIQELEEESSILLNIRISDKNYKLYLKQISKSGNPLFCTENFSVNYGSDTPINSPADFKLIRQFLTKYDKAVSYYAPELLPQKVL